MITHSINPSHEVLSVTFRLSPHWDLMEPSSTENVHWLLTTQFHSRNIHKSELGIETNWWRISVNTYWMHAQLVYWIFTGSEQRTFEQMSRIFERVICFHLDSGYACIWSDVTFLRWTTCRFIFKRVDLHFKPMSTISGKKLLVED